MENQKGEIMKFGNFAISLSIAIAGLIFNPIVSAKPAQQEQTAPDNTKMNKDQSAPTADQQKMNPTDRAITQKIRKAIHDDKSLSMYASNIKVISQDGKVTLRGPVHTEDEKSSLEAKAVTVAGQGNVTNEITVKQ
jgi:hyperosmotically inducible periplasmic protein